MWKTFLIDAADWMAAFAKRRAQRWLQRSMWWTDFADALEHDTTILEIRKEQEGQP